MRSEGLSTQSDTLYRRYAQRGKPEEARKRAGGVSCKELSAEMVGEVGIEPTTKGI
jgi:hypothetical protein